MNPDQLLSTAITVGIIALPLIAIIFFFLIRRERRASGGIDSANVTPIPDGLIIKPHRMTNIMGIVILSGLALLLLAMFANSQPNGVVWSVRVICALLVVVVLRMISGLRKPSIEINRRQQRINIGSKQIPFTDLAGISFSYSDPRMVGGQVQPFAYGSVNLMMKDESSFQLAALSGLDTVRRVKAFAALVAQMMGGEELRTRFSENQQVIKEDDVSVVRFYFNGAKG